MIPVPADHEGRRTKSGSVRLPGIEDAMAAASRIAGQVRQSPLLPLPGEDDIRLKLEVLQPTGSFKVRGVFNWALSLDPAEREAGFLTFSAGNTALALGHAARLFGVKARSILPDSAPRYKVGALRSAGVEPTLMGFGEMMDWVDAEGWHGEPQVFLHPWVDSRMIAGHATIALELFRDWPDVDTVYVPVGGGALAVGVGAVLKALRPSVRVVGVQAARCPALAASFAAGRPVRVEAKPTICDGVAVGFVADAMYPVLRKALDDVVVVPEEEVMSAIRLLAVRSRLVVEGAGALAVAAALNAATGGRGRTACLVTGGNIGPARLAAILSAPSEGDTHR
jgi:threonine dehydratase